MSSSEGSKEGVHFEGTAAPARDTGSRHIISGYGHDFASAALLPVGLSVRRSARPSVRCPPFSDATKYNVQAASRWSSASFAKTLVGVSEPTVVPSVDEVVGAGTCVCRSLAVRFSRTLPLGLLEPVWCGSSSSLPSSRLLDPAVVPGSRRACSCK